MDFFGIGRNAKPIRGEKLFLSGCTSDVGVPLCPASNVVIPEYPGAIARFAMRLYNSLTGVP